MPSGTAASIGRMTLNTGIRHSGVSGQASPTNAQQWSGSTAMPSADTWWLPVPRRPTTSHVSSIVSSSARTKTSRGVGSVTPPDVRFAHEADPGGVQAVADERPATVQAQRSVGDVERAEGGEHGRAAAVGVGEDLAGAIGWEVAGEDVAAGADDRAPCRAAVDGGDAFEHLHGVGGRSLEAAEAGGEHEPVDAGGPQGELDVVGEPAAASDAVDVLPDEGQHGVDGGDHVGGGRGGGGGHGSLLFGPGQLTSSSRSRRRPYESGGATVLNGFHQHR